MCFASFLTVPSARGSVKSSWRFPGVRGGGNLVMSPGNKQRVNPGVPAAHADSSGPRRSLPSPRALPPLAKVTPWPPAPRPECVVPATPSTPVPARRQPKLLDRLREALRSRHYSRRTGRVQMPNALDRKYPNAPSDWRWQWVFPQVEQRRPRGPQPRRWALRRLIQSVYTRCRRIPRRHGSACTREVT